MISGIVSAREGRVRLKVRGLRRQEREIDAVIDTGYTGWLTLPSTVAAALKLRQQGFGRGLLADGSQTVFEIYEATVIWDRSARRIPIIVADAVPLLGMALLNGYELKMQIRAGGKVTIKRMAKRS
jgi:clan AA aspartic protease